MILPESGFTAFEIVHILEQTVQLCKLSEHLYTDILCDWISKGSQDKDSSCYRTLNRSQDRSQDRLLDTVDKLNCQLQWPGQISFIIVLLYVLLRAYQLTVIIILIAK